MAPSWATAWERAACWREPLATCCRTKAAQHLLLAQYLTTGVDACSQPGQPSSPGLLQPLPSFPGGDRGSLPKTAPDWRQGSEVSSEQAAEQLFLKGVQSWHCPTGRHREGQDLLEKKHREWSSYPFTVHLLHAW